jgi:hypothetical protein
VHYCVVAEQRDNKRICVDLGDSRVDRGGEGVKGARRSIQGRYNV